MDGDRCRLGVWRRTRLTGPAEALVLLASGRPAPIDEATGDGVAALKERLAT